MTFKINQQVVKKGTNTEIGIIVTGPIERRGQKWYKIRFGGNVQSYLENDIKPFLAEDNLYDAFRHQIFGGHESFVIKLTLSKLFQPIKDTIYSYNSSRTELHGYQYKPLLKYLNSSSKRLLIADEVGLGKTIEAGYILQEERARRNVSRVLVVCPSTLRVKWQNEMLDRFGIHFEILDAHKAKISIPRNPDNPRTNQLYGIVSYDSIRSDSFREKLEISPADLCFLIVDEVHHCRNRETKNFKIIATLSESSGGVLFLSATPIHTSNKNLFNILNLLVPEKFVIEEAFYRMLDVNRHIINAERYLSISTPEAIQLAIKELEQLKTKTFDWDVTQDPFYSLVLGRLNSKKINTDRSFLVRTQDILSQLNILGDVLTRTRKRDVHEKSAVRSAFPVVTPFSSYEETVYQMLTQHIYMKYETNYNDQVARFVLSNIARQISSSLVAAVIQYRQLFENLDVIDDTVETDGWDEDINEDEVKSYRIADDQEFKDMVNSISIDRLEHEDSKFKRLLKIIQETKTKIILFAFYKKSLRYLEDRLNCIGINCVRIDGDVPSCPEDPEKDERKIRIDKFKNDPSPNILLSSQVGSEGLDFQFCSVLVNWDLPWNPMVVEQRIGRIDRLGQKSEKIQIYSIVSKGSIEEYILDRLYTRINIFEESVGELEQILGPRIAELTNDLLSFRLSNEEKIRKVEISAQAVLREKENIEKLESKSSELLGHNEIIQQKLEKITRLGRYMNAEHLEKFVSRFLNEYHPTSTLSDVNGERPEISSKDLRILNVDNSLRSYFATKLSSYDPEEKRFRELLQKNKIKVTFHSETALDNAGAEMIHSRHPFVLKIADFYRDNASSIQSVFRLNLISDIIEPGEYFWAWASVDETGIFTGRYLVPVFVNLNTYETIKNKELSEEILYMLLKKGEDCIEDIISFDTIDCKKLEETAEDYFMDYVDDLRQKRIIEKDAILSRRKQAIESTYSVLLERKKKAVVTAEINNRSPNVINALKAQIEYLKNDYNMKVSEVLSNSDMSTSYHLEGIGLIKINESDQP